VVVPVVGHLQANVPPDRQDDANAHGCSIAKRSLIVCEAGPAEAPKDHHVANLLGNRWRLRLRDWGWLSDASAVNRLRPLYQCIHERARQRP
jgi:hypothetical protein